MESQQENVIVEVKQAIFGGGHTNTEVGFWQLCVESIASQSNSVRNQPVYGVFTDGFTWAFLKLHNSIIETSTLIPVIIIVYALLGYEDYMI